MVFVIAAAAKSVRNTVGRLLAETLGWEFVEAENLHAKGEVEADRVCTGRHDDIRSFRTEALSTAINIWIYEWRDVAVSCPVLAEGDRKQLARISPLVKIVCLEESPATDRTAVSDLSVGIAVSRSSASAHSSRQPEQNVFILDLYRPLEDIIKELTAVLVS